jgi:uncharacterized protein YcbX
MPTAAYVPEAQDDLDAAYCDYEARSVQLPVEGQPAVSDARDDPKPVGEAGSFARGGSALLVEHVSSSMLTQRLLAT